MTTIHTLHHLSITRPHHIMFRIVETRIPIDEARIRIDHHGFPSLVHILQVPLPTSPTDQSRGIRQSSTSLIMNTIHTIISPAIRARKARVLDLQLSMQMRRKKNGNRGIRHHVGR